jgi:ubiquinone/menaquinone biosynthesis C-methylase UbiE
LAVPAQYVVAEVPVVPVRDECPDLVYTGKGALIWMRDLDAWAESVARMLKPGGQLFVYEAHPAVPSPPTAPANGSGLWARSSQPLPARV